MTEITIDGKSVEQYWTDLAAKYLIGKKIVKVEYLPQDMLKDFMWHKRPITIHLEDGSIITPQMDDEGNDGGAMLTSFEELGTIPVI
tara:strand:+ start:2485 stop:2745 length:261 start_codon:yes stop_codon:yes gene_type:complete